MPVGFCTVQTLGYDNVARSLFRQQACSAWRRVDPNLNETLIGMTSVAGKQKGVITTSVVSSTSAKAPGHDSQGAVCVRMQSRSDSAKAAGCWGLVRATRRSPAWAHGLTQSQVHAEASLNLASDCLCHLCAEKHGFR